MFSLCVLQAAEATGATSFFEMHEEETKRLMHGAVVTPMDGYCFFEDIDTNIFASSLAVPFAEYRYDNASHVGLHVNVVSAPEVISRMKACTHLGRASTTVVPVQKQFWGAELGIERDGYGILWTLSSKAASTSHSSLIDWGGCSLSPLPYHFQQIHSPFPAVTCHPFFVYLLGL